MLAAALVANRKRRGLLQKELAEAAGLSLRTVQRLAKGESLLELDASRVVGLVADAGWLGTMSAGH